MGFMSKEEITEFNKKNNRVDAGVSKRTCATCSNRKDCTLVIYFLEKTEAKECRVWSPCFKTCGNCKHLVPTTSMFYLGCGVYENPADKRVCYDQYRCDEGNWELAHDLVRYP